MQKLHLVGFTTDYEGLILSARRGSRSGSYVLVIGPSLEEAVDELRSRRAAAEEAADEEPARPPRVESALSVREVQARLRQGRTVAEVARAAGVDEAWIDRFAAPVLAERAQVIATVQGGTLHRPRLGPSALPVGEAVLHHLADRRVALTPDEIERAWSARLVGEGRWSVWFSYRYRGRAHTLRYDLDEATGDITTDDRASAAFGFVAGPAAGRTRAPAPRPTAKRAVVSTGFRPDAADTAASSRSAQERQKAARAMSEAARRRAAEAERAVARRARERAAQVERTARAGSAAERSSRSDGGAGTGTGRPEAAKKASGSKRAAPAKKAAAKEAATKKATAKKATASRGGATAKTASGSRGGATAKKATVKKATASNRGATAKTKTAKKATGSTRAATAKRAATTRKATRKKASGSKRATTAKRAAAKRATKSKTAPTADTVPASKATAARETKATGKPVPAMERTTVTPSGSPLSRPGGSDGTASQPRRPVVLPTRPNPAEAGPALGPRFRPGLVEPADPPGSRPSPETGNGERPRPGPALDRPRRTRPLRAT